MADKPPLTYPISIRLTFQERAALETQAGDLPLSTYMRESLLDPAKSDRLHYKRRSRIEDEKALASVMGQLGQSRIANNLNQLAKAANLGTLPVSEETEQQLVAAARDIAIMRESLLRALGFERRPS